MRVGASQTVVCLSPPEGQRGQGIFGAIALYVWSQSFLAGGGRGDGGGGEARDTGRILVVYCTCVYVFLSCFGSAAGDRILAYLKIVDLEKYPEGLGRESAVKKEEECFL